MPYPPRELGHPARGVAHPPLTVAENVADDQGARSETALDAVQKHVAEALAEVSARERDLFAVVNDRLQNAKSPTDEIALRRVKAKLIAMLEARADMADAWSKVADETESAIARMGPVECERNETLAQVEDVECVIDLSNIERGEEVVRLPCMHVFHKDCIMPYLLRENVPLCPIDRSHVPKRNVPFLPVWKWRC